MKKRRKGSLLAQQELDRLKEQGDLLTEQDVCWVQVDSRWEIDDSYIFLRK